MGLNKQTKTPCGFCFVEFDSKDEAALAKECLDHAYLEGRQIRVDWDVGFEWGRQYGRGRSGCQVRDEVRANNTEQVEDKDRPATNGDRRAGNYRGGGEGGEERRGRGRGGWRGRGRDGQSQWEDGGRGGRGYRGRGWRGRGGNHNQENREEEQSTKSTEWDNVVVIQDKQIRGWGQEENQNNDDDKKQSSWGNDDKTDQPQEWNEHKKQDLSDVKVGAKRTHQHSETTLQQEDKWMEDENDTKISQNDQNCYW